MGVFVNIAFARWLKSEKPHPEHVKSRDPRRDQGQKEEQKRPCDDDVSQGLGETRQLLYQPLKRGNPAMVRTPTSIVKAVIFIFG